MVHGCRCIFDVRVCFVIGFLFVFKFKEKVLEALASAPTKTPWCHLLLHTTLEESETTTVTLTVKMRV